MACWQQAKMLYKYKGSRHTRTHTHTPTDELNQSSGTAELRYPMLPNATSMLFNAIQCYPMLSNATSMLFQCYPMPSNATQCYPMLSNAIQCDSTGGGGAIQPVPMRPSPNYLSKPEGGAVGGGSSRGWGGGFLLGVGGRVWPGVRGASSQR